MRRAVVRISNYSTKEENNNKQTHNTYHSHSLRREDLGGRHDSEIGNIDEHVTQSYNGNAVDYSQRQISV